ncbi:hypothetical protein KCU93_g371, partial [Aureobasidium melanogenum]
MIHCPLVLFSTTFLVLLLCLLPLFQHPQRLPMIGGSVLSECLDEQHNQTRIAHSAAHPLAQPLKTWDGLNDAYEGGEKTHDVSILVGDSSSRSGAADNHA